MRLALGLGTRWWRRAAVCPLLLLLVIAQGVSAQGPRFLRDTTSPGDPIQVLLDRGGELHLTAKQVSRLQTVQRQLWAANDPLVAQLVTLRHQVGPTGRIPHRSMSPEQRAAFQDAVRRARPLMQAIGQNNYQAMQRVSTILTPAQKALVRTWLPHGPGMPGQRIPHGGPGRGPGPGAGGAGARFQGLD